jgi:dUTP pyrophosphatase
MIFNLKKLSPNARMPEYAHGPCEDAGMDLFLSESISIPINRPVLAKTGIAIELPPGYEAQIRSRSGLALKQGVSVLNSPGTIDPSYRGEIGVILNWNGHNPQDYSPLLHLEKGTKIAQIVVSRYEPVSFEAVEELSASGRGTKGFGSTGNS